MSSGQEKPLKLITLDPDEFNRVVKRVHEFLLKRADKAATKWREQPSEKNEEKCEETAKDVFALVHMLELIEHMTGEISDLRSMLEDANEHIEMHHSSDDTLDGVPEMFSIKKTDYLN